MESSELYNYSAVLRATGADANAFLQGQFSQDLAAEAPCARYGLWLDFRGKVHGDAFVLRLGRDEFLIISYHTPAAVLSAHLEKCIVADDVTLRDETAKWCGCSVAGEHAASELAAHGLQLPLPSRFTTAQGAHCWAGRRARVENFEVMSPRSTGGATMTWDAAAAERRRIEDGIPAVPIDLGPGDLPQEGGLEQAAISFTKGCFIGQEVVARLHNLGQVRRRLMLVRGAGEAPALGAPLFQGDRKVGELRSSARASDGFVALAMISLVQWTDGGRLAATPEARPAIEVVRPAGD